MSAVKPRMAVAYHFFKDYDTTPSVYDRIRKTYDGPLSRNRSDPPCENQGITRQT
jgi:hypothetical protein